LLQKKKKKIIIEKIKKKNKKYNKKKKKKKKKKLLKSLWKIKFNPEVTEVVQPKIEKIIQESTKLKFTDVPSEEGIFRNKNNWKWDGKGN